MSELVLDADEFVDFSVPHPLCLAGEFQYALGLGSIVIATDLRVQAHVEETADEFELLVAPADDFADGDRELVARWRKALQNAVADDVEELAGLRILLGWNQAEGRSPGMELASPAIAVALTCAVKARRGSSHGLPADDLAEFAAALLQDFFSGRRCHPDRFYTECLGCIEGGARYISSSAESINVQLMIPPESLLLAVNHETAVSPEAPSWETVLHEALNKLGRKATRLLEETERDVSPLFEMANGMLDERETTVLYGLLRVREMMAAQIEKLGQPLLDHDLIAELCDEESSILEDYFEFPAAPYYEVRNRAVENGALGAKLTHAFGDRPAIIILAPGHRDQVKKSLEKEFRDCRFLAVEVDPKGASGAETLETDDATESE